MQFLGIFNLLLTEMFQLLNDFLLHDDFLPVLMLPLLLELEVLSVFQHQPLHLVFYLDLVIHVLFAQ
jgi:hypothetical protein